MHNYDLKAAILAHTTKKPKQVNPLKTPPHANAAPNQPTQKNGGLAEDDFERQINNEAGNPNANSSKNSANNPKNSQQNDLNYKKSGISNPNNDANDINPPLKMNKTPFQLIKQIAGVLQRYGLPTLWQQSFPCPCLASDGMPKANCPVCHGLGLAFKDPVELNIAFQHDNRQYYNGSNGNEDTGLTLATPQITENGIENGISPRDRLAVDGLSVTQSYIFNVSQDRINTGEYIPYHVQSIDLAVTMDSNNNLIKLQEGKDFTFNQSTSVLRPKKQWLNHNISLLMSVALRFYVVNELKETRYATSTELSTNKSLMGWNKPNKLLTNYVRKYARATKPGEVYFRMPKLLQVRRENVVLGNWDYSKNNGTKQRNTRYQETKVSRNPNNPLNVF